MTGLFDALDPPPKSKPKDDGPAVPSDGITRNAIFRREGVRLLLTRFWKPGPRALWIGHNPSDAGKDRDDPTSRRVVDFTRSWDVGGADMSNLYPWVGADPAECRAIRDQKTAEQAADQLDAMAMIRTLAARAPAVIVCWGDLPDDPVWIDHMIYTLARAITKKPVKLYCLGTNDSGSPRHPMSRGKSRVPDDQKPIVWRTL